MTGLELFEALQRIPAKNIGLPVAVLDVGTGSAWTTADIEVRKDVIVLLLGRPSQRAEAPMPGRTVHVCFEWGDHEISTPQAAFATETSARQWCAERDSASGTMGGDMVSLEVHP